MNEYENHNPDVLSCLASLSNDEIFTPPNIANEMLNLLPEEIWSNPKIKFLDPCCKSGIFLREIAKRLIEGLKGVYPDLQERINHICKEQLYGIAITELTSLLSRRSLYCSKYANGEYSICSDDFTEEGHIIFESIHHTWSGNNCKFCGVNRSNFDRLDDLEIHAYSFIHTLRPEEIFRMKFDVIIGNPPYQMNDGGGDGTSAAPIYHLFIDQAKKLNPRYLTMIVPARWYSGGKGLNQFRSEMLSDDRLCVIHDFPETNDCFPGLNIRGGVCYFLWDSTHSGDCTVYNHHNGIVDVSTRPLLEDGSETFIRYNQAISILRKVKKFNEPTMDQCVSSRLPFGISSNFSNYSDAPTASNTVMLFRSDRGAKKDRQFGYVDPKYITKNIELKDSMKVLVSKASPGGDEYPHSIITTPIIAPLNSVCTETYLIVKVVDSEEEGKNLISYMETKFFRFLMSLIKNTQNISKGVFAFVPIQDLSHPWSDSELYKKYGIDEHESKFIDTLIRPMVSAGEDNGS